MAYRFNYQQIQTRRLHLVDTSAQSTEFINDIQAFHKSHKCHRDTMVVSVEWRMWVGVVMMVFVVFSATLTIAGERESNKGFRRKGKSAKWRESKWELIIFRAISVEVFKVIFKI